MTLRKKILLRSKQTMKMVPKKKNITKNTTQDTTENNTYEDDIQFS